MQIMPANGVGVAVSLGQGPAPACSMHWYELLLSPRKLALISLLYLAWRLGGHRPPVVMDLESSGLKVCAHTFLNKYVHVLKVV